MNDIEFLIVGDIDIPVFTKNKIFIKSSKFWIIMVIVIFITVCLIKVYFDQKKDVVV